MATCIWASKKEYAKAIADYNSAIRINPRYALAYVNRGDTWGHARLRPAPSPTIKSACPQSRQLRHLDQTGTALGDLSLVATMGDGLRAKEAATKACELTRSKNPTCLTTLAAAYAEAGEFDTAIKWQTEAQHFASDADPKAKAESGRVLALYQAKKALRTD